TPSTNWKAPTPGPPAKAWPRSPPPGRRSGRRSRSPRPRWTRPRRSIRPAGWCATSDPAAGRVATRPRRGEDAGRRLGEAGRMRATWMLLLAVVLLGACRREVPPPAQEIPGAREPAQAVLLLTAHLRSNDLPAFARDAVPPDLYRQ